MQRGRRRQGEAGKRKAWIVRERAAGAAGLVIINAGGKKRGSCKGPITAVRERTRILIDHLRLHGAKPAALSSRARLHSANHHAYTHLRSKRAFEPLA